MDKFLEQLKITCPRYLFDQLRYQIQDVREVSNTLCCVKVQTLRFDSSVHKSAVRIQNYSSIEILWGPGYEMDMESYRTGQPLVMLQHYSSFFTRQKFRLCKHLYQWTRLIVSSCMFTSVFEHTNKWLRSARHPAASWIVTQYSSTKVFTHLQESSTNVFLERNDEREHPYGAAHPSRDDSPI